MAVATAHCVALSGAVGHLVDVQADVSPGQIGTTLVGRVDAALNEGRDRVRQMYEASTRLYDGGTPLTKHVTTNAQVHVEGERGSARSYFTVFQATPALPLQPIISGRYHDTFHRLEGRWWFESRTMLVDHVGDLSHHLLF